MQIGRRHFGREKDTAFGYDATLRYFFPTIQHRRDRDDILYTNEIIDIALTEFGSVVVKAITYTKDVRCYMNLLGYLDGCWL